MTASPPPRADVPTAATNATTSPTLDDKALRASEERRLEIGRAEAEKAKAEAERAQAEAERARAEADVLAAKERAEAEARRKAAEQAQSEQDAHGIQP